MKLSVTSLIFDLFHILLENALHVGPGFRAFPFLSSNLLFHFHWLLLHILPKIRIALLCGDALFFLDCEFLRLLVVVHSLPGLDYVVFGDAQAKDLSLEGGSIDWISMGRFLMKGKVGLTLAYIFRVILPITAIFTVMSWPFLQFQYSRVGVLDSFVEHGVDIAEIIIMQELGDEVKGSSIVKAM